MALDCYCDYDPPEVYSSRIVSARKPYRFWTCASARSPSFSTKSLWKRP